ERQHDRLLNEELVRLVEQVVRDGAVRLLRGAGQQLVALLAGEATEVRLAGATPELDGATVRERTADPGKDDHLVVALAEERAQTTGGQGDLDAQLAQVLLNQLTGQLTQGVALGVGETDGHVGAV